MKLVILSTLTMKNIYASSHTIIKNTYVDWKRIKLRDEGWVHITGEAQIESAEWPSGSQKTNWGNKP